MEDGELALRFEAGRIVSVSVGAGLDEAYSRLFEAARANAQSSQKTIDSGIAIVVFGCMWIEALCNGYLSELLARTIPPEGRAEALWTALERISIGHKLKILATFDDDSGDRAWVGLLERVFQLRNSLVHFRDRHVSVPALEDVHELESYVAQLPEADLIRQLKPPAIDATAAAIVSSKERLDAIYRRYVPTERVPLAPESDAGDAV